MALHRVVVAGALVVGCGPVITEPSADNDGTTTGTIDPPSDTGTSVPGTSATGTSVGTSEPGTVATSDETSDETTDAVLDVGGSCGPFGCPDGGGSDECDVWSQDCSDGEKCQPWANDGGDRWNATSCFPIDPNPAQLGDECVVEGSPTSGIDNCAFGSMCFHVDPETNVGTCVALCGGNEVKPECDDQATTCSITHEGVLVLCLPTCDPLLQDCPQPNHACTPNDAGYGFVCFPTYAPVAAAGEPCPYFDSCIAGTACVPGDRVVGCVDESCCAPFCDDTDPDVDPTCPGYADGELCESWYPEPGIPDPPPQPIGVCALPG